MPSAFLQMALAIYYHIFNTFNSLLRYSYLLFWGKFNKSKNTVLVHLQQVEQGLYL